MMTDGRLIISTSIISFKTLTDSLQIVKKGSKFVNDRARLFEPKHLINALALFFLNFSDLKEIPIFAHVDVMKGIILILSLLLSCVHNSTGERHDIYEGRFRGTLVSSTDKSTAEKEADLNDLAILPVRTATYSGDGNSFAPSLRPTNSGRRVQPSFKSSFRVIKAGKVLNRNNYCSFQAAILQYQSGIRSNSRYIYSICQLLI